MRKLFVSLLMGLLLFAQPALLLPVEASSKSKPAKTVQQEETVDFNTNSLKFHKPSCKWAIRCTQNCIHVPKSEAIQRGGIPCKVCGG